MTTRLNPPDWDAYDSNMLINVGDMKYYYENFTDVVDAQATANKLDIQTLDGRVAAIEHSIPVGPGGKGAFIDLGGVPGSYPSAQQMVEGDSPEETSFLVVARTDGIYFYNPKSKVLIPPKSGGGAIAVHAQFPQIFDAGHSLTYNGRAGMSGVYTAKSADIGLGGEFTTFDGCKLLVVVNDDGEEFQTAFSPDGTASRIFRKGSQTAVWGFSSGGGGGGGSVDPIVIQEIKDRLDHLEGYDHLENITELKDVVLDSVTDVNGILYMDATGKIRGGSTNPMLSMGAAHVHTNAVGAPPVVSGANISATVVASNNTIIFKGTLAKQVNLPNVVAYNTYQPSTNQVREGRTTFIVNTSDVSLTVRAPTGGMFYIEGNMDSTNAVIPAKTVFVYNPAILDNGSGAMIECWIYMGNYPLRATDLSSVLADIQDIKDAMVSKDDLKTGNLPVSEKSLYNESFVNWDSASQADIAKSPIFHFWGNSVNKTATLPDIVAGDTNPLPSNAVRVGRMVIIANKSSTNKTIKVASSCKFYGLSSTGNDESTADWTLKPGCVVMFNPLITNGVKRWCLMGALMGSHLADYNDTVNRVAALENNAAYIGTSNIWASAGKAHKVVIQQSTSSGLQIWLQNIKLFSETIGTNDDYQGKHKKYVNQNTNPTSLKAFDECPIKLPDGTTTTSLSLAGGHVAEVIGEVSGSNRYWRLLHIGPIDDTSIGTDISGVEARLDTVEDGLADHIADFTAMQDGNIPTSWNGLGARPVTSLNDITAENLADSPFCIGTGSVAGKKFILPNIVDKDVTTLTNEDVREGRTTYLINLGTVERTVELTNGCKINLTGGTTSASQTIPRKTVWMFSPGIYAGEKVWTFIGTLSAQTLDIESLVDRLAALESRPVIEKFTDLTDTPADYRPGQVLRYNQMGDAVISTEFAFKQMTDTPNDYGGQKGKMLVVNNGETAISFQSVPDTSGLQTQIDTAHNSIIALENMDTVIGNRVTALENAPPAGATEFTGLSDTPANYTGHGGKAVVVNSGATALEFASVPTAAAVDANTAWRTKVESGDSSGKVNSNCMYGAMQCLDSNLSATQLAACTAGYIYGTTARSAVLPKVVDINVSSLGADEARFGKQIRLANMTTQGLTVTVQGGGRIYKPDNNFATTVTIEAGKFADFHAVWWPGGGWNKFAWVMMIP